MRRDQRDGTARLTLVEVFHHEAQQRAAMEREMIRLEIKERNLRAHGIAELLYNEEERDG